MKYIRYKSQDKEHIGVLRDDKILRLDYTSIIEAVLDEENIKEKIETTITDNLNKITILPPVEPTKIVCVGLNYKDHADELEMILPEEPLLFMKPSTSIITHKEDIIYPQDTKKLDFEAELGIVILTEVSRDDTNYKLAYTIINDVTARDLQEKDGQWTRSKSFDTFCPVGPVIVTDINPSNQKIYSKVNGEIKQNSNTNNMIFTPDDLVKYVSNIMTLKPGDLIATGTPPGIDHLEKGDTITIGIEDIGELENTVK